MGGSGIVTACLCTHVPVVLPVAVIVAGIGTAVFGSTFWWQRHPATANGSGGTIAAIPMIPASPQTREPQMPTTIVLVSHDTILAKKIRDAHNDVHVFDTIRSCRAALDDRSRGLVQILDQPHTLVLLDLLLPDGDGRDFCGYLRSGAHPARARIVALKHPRGSSSIMQSTRHLQHIGFDGCITNGNDNDKDKNKDKDKDWDSGLHIIRRAW